MGTLQEGLQKLKDAKWKTVSDYEEEAKAKVKPGVPPARLSKEQKEEVQLKNERARDPEGFDKREQMYKSAEKFQAENFKNGGKVSASKRADGCAVRGKTKGRIV